MKKENLDKKQIILAVVILLVAIMLLAYGFTSNKGATKVTDSSAVVSQTTQAQEPASKEFRGVELNFTINMPQDSDFQVYYTTDEKEEFSEEKSVNYQGKKGENQYNIALPVSEVVYIRLKIKSAQEQITLKDMYVSGAQEALLNEIPYFEMFQFDKIKINADGSLTFNTMDDSAYISYYKNIKQAAKETEEALQKIVPITNAEEAPIIDAEDAPIIDLEEVPAPEAESSKNI